MASQTAQLERETEEARIRVEQTLEELRFRVSPGQLLDRATDYLRNSNGRAFVSNLREQVVTNPLPVTLVGAGIALLALSSRTNRETYEGGSSQYRHRDRPSRDGVQRADEPSEDTDGAVSRAGEWIDEARSAATETAANVRDKAHEYKDSAAGWYRNTKQGVRRAANSAMEYGQTLQDAVGADGALLDLCRRQPVLVAGIGLAIGAALGSLLPVTRVEQRTMGKASRTMKERSETIADEAVKPTSSAGSKPQAGNGGRRDQPDQATGSDLAERQRQAHTDAVPPATIGEGIV
jgi:Protein of unknown function (DUF3618)